MAWSYRIARVAGIEVRIHATFLLLVLFWGWQGWQYGGAAEAAVSVAFGCLLFLCVLLHEFGHAFAARAYGIRTPDITLLPIGGVARLERMPDKPSQELVVAIAGPMVNVAIALGLTAVLGWPARGGIDDLALPGRDLLGQLRDVNVMLVLFNLLPAFPMDGGRVLRALLSIGLGHERATKIAARVGQGVALVFALIGVFGIPGLAGPNPFLLFIAMFVFMGAQQEASFAGFQAAASRLRVRDAMTSAFQNFSPDTPLASAADEAAADSQPIYPVTDRHLRLVGMVLRNEVIDAARKTPGSPLHTVLRNLPAVAADASFGEAFRLMQESGSPVLPVVNPGRQVVGLVSLNLLRDRLQNAR